MCPIAGSYAQADVRKHCLVARVANRENHALSRK
jgi:hypothetical protein